MTKFLKDVNIDANVCNTSNLSVIEDLEQINALQAIRTASWLSIFYLIMTDILGPFNTPFAISQVGYLPSIF